MMVLSVLLGTSPPSKVIKSLVTLDQPGHKVDLWPTRVNKMLIQVYEKSTIGMSYYIARVSDQSIIIIDETPTSVTL